MMATQTESHKFEMGDPAHVGFEGPRANDCFSVSVMSVTPSGKSVEVVDCKTGSRKIVFRLTTRKRGGTQFRAPGGLILKPGFRDHRDPHF